jgi:hypothetical protein
LEIIMRTLTLLAVLGAMSMSASALAGPAGASGSGDSSVISVQTIPGVSYKPRPAEIEGVQGTYSLSNGEVMKISTEHRRLWAEFNNKRKSELIPIAPNTFVARGDRTTIEFDQLPFATEVTLTRN